MSPRTALADCWYHRCPWLFPLLPLSWLFAALSRLRRGAYRHGLLPSIRLPVPVVIVGNITVGGTGKTPFVIWLVETLRLAGWHPGILSRGHGGASTRPALVTADSEPRICGDEPVLLARRAACPVWIGRRRGEAGKALLAAHPEVNVLVCDDGLQHYALARDVEIVLLDGARGVGNGRPLPAGPLREGVGRLAEVDAVVVNGPADRPLPSGVALPEVFAMRLDAGAFGNVRHPERRVGADHFVGMSVHAVAGIGHPERFFTTLARLGIKADNRAFPDHHAFRSGDLPEGLVLMTEKDAVKCAGFGRDDLWALGVDAQVGDGLQSLIISRLKTHHGQQTA